MDKNEYYRMKVKEINEERRAGFYPANNHLQRNQPTEAELQLTKQLYRPGPIREAPLILYGWQYCRACLDLIARIRCEDCQMTSDQSLECSHLTRLPLADPAREVCDWCYFQFYIQIRDRGAKAQSGKQCEKCNKTTNIRTRTYQNDTSMIVCVDCQRECIYDFMNDTLNSYSSWMQRGLQEGLE